MHEDKNPESRLVETISDMAMKLTVRQQYELINYIEIISKGDEKRDAERKALKVSVDYSVKDRFYSDILENISAGGAFIRTTRLFRTGNSATLVFFMPKLEKNIKVKGEIVRLTDDGFGVRFAEESKEKLNDMYSRFWQA